MGIHVLDETTVNKIAAGEVVESPASVVKELVENAIDAGATFVTVEIENGGIQKIRVTDNGAGIAAGEVVLAFMRHATSKIFDYRDMQAVSTLGFRGEALSSIAAVSVTEIAAKERTAELGCAARFEGGHETEVREAGMPDGTTVTVRNLFYNTPARFKFLKSPVQEVAAVSDVVARLVLSHPEVSVRYISNAQTVYHSPGNGRAIDALVALYGKDIARKVVPVDHAFEQFRVHGFIGLPQYAMRNRRSQTFVVNGRYVKAPNLSRYVQDAYSQRILKGHYPFALLYVELAYRLTDVNVHPNKLTVRFRDEGKAAYVVGEAVNAALKKANLAGILPETDRRFAEEETPASSREGAAGETGRTASMPYAGPDTPQSRFEQASLFMSGSLAKMPDTLHADDGVFFDVIQGVSAEKEAGETESPPTAAGFLPDMPYKVLGQAFDSYIVLECADQLVLIDQHAAHERFLYDRMVAAMQKGDALSSPLLMPKVFTVTHGEKTLIDENRALLHDVGFDLEDFGPLSYRVTAIPYALRDAGEDALLDGLMDALKAGETSPDAARPALDAHRIIQASCKRAIKANMRLNEREIGFIIDTYRNGAMPTCPHGRPLVTVITRTQIEKGFRRRL